VTAGLVRVPAAWGEGGSAMCGAAAMDLGVPTVATVSMSSLAEQTAAVAAALPDVPVVLGGCCCAHVGAAAGLAARHGRIAVVWFDAHGDLNTSETSPSGNLWGMPYRMVLDGGHAAPGDCALLGARNLDPAEDEYIADTALATSADALQRVLDGTAGTYIAFDCDVLEPSQIDCFMPEPGGPSLDECVGLVAAVARLQPVLGIGLTGLVASTANPPRLRRIVDAALPGAATAR
jgi:arginase